MASKTTIINLALIKLGESPIRDNDNSDDRSRTANIVYDQILDEVLADGPEKGWRFARERVTISVDSESPDFGYDYQFKIPADCIPAGVLSVEIDGVEITDWITEGDYILTNLEDSEIDVIYIKRVTESGRYPPHFVKALSFALAIAFGAKRTAKDNLVAQLTREYEFSVLPKARGKDGRAMYSEDFNNNVQEAGRSGANLVDGE